MNTIVKKVDVIALLTSVAILTSGCSSFHSSSSDYVKPEGLCNDVSLLPDPNAPPKNSDADNLQNIANQYGLGGQKFVESPERLLAQANAYFEQKRYHDSARLYKKYLATPVGQAAAPEILSVAHYRIGYVARKKMFLEEAKNEFQKACQYAPGNDEYLFSYAQACYDAADYSSADYAFSQLLARSPSYPEAQYRYGLTLLEGVDRTKALAPLQASVGDLQAYALLTDKYYSTGELELARQTEAQTTQVAAQLGMQVPEFPHKNKPISVSVVPALVGRQPVGTVPTPGYVAPTQTIAAPAPELVTNAPQYVPTPIAVPAAPSVVGDASYVPATESVPESTTVPTIAQEPIATGSSIAVDRSNAPRYDSVEPTYQAGVAPQADVDALSELPITEFNDVAPTESQPSPSIPVYGVPEDPTYDQTAVNAAQPVDPVPYSAASVIQAPAETPSDYYPQYSVPTQETPYQPVPTQEPFTQQYVPTSAIPQQGFGSAYPSPEPIAYQDQSTYYQTTPSPYVQSAPIVQQIPTIPVEQAQTPYPAVVPNAVVPGIYAPETIDVISNGMEDEDDDFAFAQSGSQATPSVQAPTTPPQVAVQPQDPYEYYTNAQMYATPQYAPNAIAPY